MPKGGPRLGAGRRPGSKNAMSMKIRAEAQETGELPHEFLLRIARGESIDGHKITFEERVDAAKAAAPYYAPKLSSVDQTLAGTLGYVAVPTAERDSLDAAERAASGGDPETLG